MKLYAVLILLGLFFASCNLQNVTRNKMNEKIVSDWKYDSTGCMELRTIAKAKYIKDSLDLINKQKELIINYLGEPNFNFNDGSTNVIRYYFDTFCQDNKIIDSIDYCWIEFSIKNKKVDQINIVCY